MEPAGARPGRARDAGRPGRSRSPGARPPRGGMDGCRCLRPRAGAGAHPQCPGHRRARARLRGEWGETAGGLHQRGVSPATVRTAAAMWRSATATHQRLRHLQEPAAEEAAAAAFDGRDGLWVVRVAWLFGPTGDDFPERIVRVADRLAPQASLGGGHDEHGNPTCTPPTWRRRCWSWSIARSAAPGTWQATHPPRGRSWVARVLPAAPARPGHPCRLPDGRSARTTPPAWGVLDTGHATAQGFAMRPARGARGGAGAPGRRRTARLTRTPVPPGLSARPGPRPGRTRS